MQGSTDVAPIAIEHSMMAAVPARCSSVLRWPRLLDPGGVPPPQVVCESGMNCLRVSGLWMRSHSSLRLAEEVLHHGVARHVPLRVIDWVSPATTSVSLQGMALLKSLIGVNERLLIRLRLRRRAEHCDLRSGISLSTVVLDTHHSSRKGTERMRRCPLALSASSNATRMASLISAPESAGARRHRWS
jgi:hypothetical protein